MLLLRHATRSRFLLLHRSLGAGSGINPSLSSVVQHFCSLVPAVSSTGILGQTVETLPFLSRELVKSFKEWFEFGNSSAFSRIFEILSADEVQDRSASDHALSQLNLHLSEQFVLDVLQDGRRRPHGVLICLKFFDWAGRQPHFFHTRATFLAMFKILARAKRESAMLDFLDDIERNAYKLRFRDTLVMGYAVAGKLDIALRLFGKMRYNGLDLDPYAYQVLLNALIQNRCFDAVKVLEKQVSIRGLDTAFIHSITLKSLCKRNELDRAREYLDDLLREGKEIDVQLVGTLTAALCQHNKFEQAHSLIEEFRELGVARVEYIYGIWITELIRAGKLNTALEFFQTKQRLEGFIPDVFRYNWLIFKLLRKNQFWDVFDLLMEMKGNKIPPDWGTVNVALCFFCKIGMVDVALELYNSCRGFIFSPSCMFYNFLINALCGVNSTDEAYHFWKTSIASGYFPGKKSFAILTDALYRENKLDEMIELVLAALLRNFVPSASTFDQFVSALCKTRRVEEGYEFSRELSKIPSFNQRASSFVHLIRAFNRSDRGDMSAELLIELRKKGLKVHRSLYKSVIQSLINMDYPIRRVLALLENLLPYAGLKPWIFHFFIDGAGSAKRSELAREIYEIMKRTGMTPDLNADILVLRSYLKNGRIFDALNFYNDIRQRREIKRRIYSTMITGLCQAGRTDYALEFFKEMRPKGLIPSIECYESLVMRLCSDKNFEVAIEVLDDYMKVGRRITSFIGNTLLAHSLQTPKLYEAWFRGADTNEVSDIRRLGRLIGACCGRIRMVADHVENVEEAIKECFPPDKFTYNLLLKIFSASNVGDAINLYNLMLEKDVEPNRWTYEIIIQGLIRHGRRDEAEAWYQEMFLKGFAPTRQTRLLL